MQEGTIWERPLGTYIVASDGTPIPRGADGSREYTDLRIIDKDGKDVDYTPSWAQGSEPSSESTLGQTLGESQASVTGKPTATSGVLPPTEMRKRSPRQRDGRRNPAKPDVSRSAGATAKKRKVSKAAGRVPEELPKSMAITPPELSVQEWISRGPSAGVSRLWDSLPEEQRAELVREASKHRIEFKDMVARIEAMLNWAIEDHRKSLASGKTEVGQRGIFGKGDPYDKGLLWYSAVNRVARERSKRHGLPWMVYVALIAATSPRQRWDWEDRDESDRTKYPNLNTADILADVWAANPVLEVTPEFVKAQLSKRKKVDYSGLTGSKMKLQDIEDTALAGRLLAHHGHLYVEPNVVMVDRAINALAVLQFNAAAERANQKVMLEDIQRVLGGFKVRSFFQAIANPASGGAVVDMWSSQVALGRTAYQGLGQLIEYGFFDIKALLGEKFPDYNAKFRVAAGYKQATVYHLIAAAYEEVAAKYDLPVHAVQAITWYVIRDYGFAHMPRELMEDPNAAVEQEEEIEEIFQ